MLDNLHLQRIGIHPEEIVRKLTARDLSESRSTTALSPCLCISGLRRQQTAVARRRRFDIAAFAGPLDRGLRRPDRRRGPERIHEKVGSHHRGDRSLCQDAARGERGATMTEPTLADWKEMYAALRRIRLFEGQVQRLAAAGEIPGFPHLSTGQGHQPHLLGAQAWPEDVLFTSHRGHGTCSPRQRPHGDFRRDFRKAERPVRRARRFDAPGRCGERRAGRDRGRGG